MIPSFIYLLAFSNGQITFALLFAACFAIVMLWAYKRDKQKHKNYYKGSYKVLAVIVAFFTFIYLIVKLIK